MGKFLQAKDSRLDKRMDKERIYEMMINDDYLTQVLSKTV